ncbi:TonB family protein [Desulforhopalus vacuolatus]|uniref:cell envelope integrity protein TolA n=1 Tax=Desulforhopalus vacuolatus TaxID=40414 RepID=UPI001966B191|nr:cell envelope integrity protein TolA [Desulforhopalus vacuolatus]MBM9520931.1 TonB family protein [Desulforhopalus vacuolatus]
MFLRPADHHRNVDWQIPLLCAIALHLLISGGAVYAPHLFKATPRIAEVQTVSLVSLPSPPERSVRSPATTKKIEKKIPTAPKPVSKPRPVPILKKNTPADIKKVSPPPAAAETVSTGPPKIISLNPKKSKIKKEVPRVPEKDLAAEKRQLEQKEQQKALAVKKIREDQRRRAVAEKQRQNLARQLREQENLDQQDKLACEKAKLARERLEEERELLKQADEAAAEYTAAINSARQGTYSGSNSAADSSIARMYNGEIAQRLAANWRPPVNITNPDMKATVAVTINQNGNISEMHFEKSSGDRVYDQFVTRAVETSAPFPPIPLAMHVSELNYGFVFTPQGVM